jgi:hypothetical protein
MASNFLTRAEFSKEIGISISTINRGIKKGIWPFTAFVRIGSRIRYPMTLVELLEKEAFKSIPEGTKK